MKVRAAFLAILLLCAGLPVAAQSTQTAFIDFALIIDSTAGGVSFPSSVTSAAVGPRASYVCTGQLETAAIRFTYAGTTAPTTTVGRPLAVGQVLQISGFDNVVNFRAIRTTGSSATMFVTCAVTQ